MSTYLFQQTTVRAILSDKINQDPLEKFFGVQRQRGKSNEHPNMLQFCHNTQALRVVNSVSLHVTRGNTRGNKSTNEDEISDEPLAKRPRRQAAQAHH